MAAMHGRYSMSKDNRQERDSNSIPTDAARPRNSDHLANERTFLAWIRTSISVVGLGFVVAKFSVWLRELASRFGNATTEHHVSLSLPLGVAMMSMGGVLSLMASWRYRRVRRAIELGHPAADERTVMIVTLMVVGMSAALVVYMLVSRQ